MNMYKTLATKVFFILEKNGAIPNNTELRNINRSIHQNTT